MKYLNSSHNVHVHIFKIIKYAVFFILDFYVKKKISYRLKRYNYKCFKYMTNVGSRSAQNRGYSKSAIFQVSDHVTKCNNSCK